MDKFIKYADLNEVQRTRYISVVNSLHDGDCLSLVKFLKSEAYDFYKNVVNFWGKKPTPIFYENAWELMNHPRISAFVLNK